MNAPETLEPGSQGLAGKRSERTSHVQAAEDRPLKSPLLMPWHSELLAVDFRNAILPWLTYVLGLCSLAYLFLNNEGRNLAQWNFYTSFGLVTLSGAAVVTLIFSADFGHGTAERLLACPVNRGSVWLVRLLLSAGLILVPCILLFASKNLASDANRGGTAIVFNAAL